MESILLALELTGYGLGGVFISLILLYLIIRVTGKVFKSKSE
jgi:Na+-transporting methylmalonyl-CoA/oxaloacetate decarboxylase gamma subunit